MDFDVRQAEDGGGFFGELLDTVFAEEALAGGVGFEDGFGGVHLADCHDCYFAGGAIGAAAGGGDLVVEVGEVFWDV